MTAGVEDSQLMHLALDYSWMTGARLADRILGLNSALSRIFLLAAEIERSHPFQIAAFFQ